MTTPDKPLTEAELAALDPSLWPNVDGKAFPNVSRIIASHRLRDAEASLLRGEVETLKAVLTECADAQKLPSSFAFTGTDSHALEDMFNADHRHKASKPFDYLKSWLAMLRPFAYATQDDSWGEMEKLVAIIMRNYVTCLVAAGKARAAPSGEGQ